MHVFYKCSMRHKAICIPKFLIIYFFCVPGYDSESDDDLAITSDELTDRDKLLISQINKIWELEVELLELLENNKETNNNIGFQINNIQILTVSHNQNKRAKKKTKTCFVTFQAFL